MPPLVVWPEAWERETEDLVEQLAVIRGELVPEAGAAAEDEKQREEEVVLTNKDYFWDYEGS